jgi:hypothetical protein
MNPMRTAIARAVRESTELQFVLFVPGSQRWGRQAPPSDSLVYARPISLDDHHVVVRPRGDSPPERYHLTDVVRVGPAANGKRVLTRYPHSKSRSTRVEQF